MQKKEQMKKCVEICMEWKDCIAAEPFVLSRIITVDEARIHHLDPLQKQKSITWKSPNSPRQKKVRQQKSPGKVMSMAFFNRRGVVYQHIVLQ